MALKSKKFGPASKFPLLLFSVFDMGFDSKSLKNPLRNPLKNPAKNPARNPAKNPAKKI